MRRPASKASSAVAIASPASRDAATRLASQAMAKTAAHASAPASPAVSGAASTISAAGASASRKVYRQTVIFRTGRRQHGRSERRDPDSPKITPRRRWRMSRAG